MKIVGVKPDELHYKRNSVRDWCSLKKLTSSLLTKVYVLPAPGEECFFNGRHVVCATPLLQYVPDFLNSSCSEEEDTRQRARSEEVTPPRNRTLLRTLSSTQVRTNDTECHAPEAIDHIGSLAS